MLALECGCEYMCACVCVSVCMNMLETEFQFGCVYVRVRAECKHACAKLSTDLGGGGHVPP